LAEDLGTADGSVSHIFLPHWLADNLFEVYTPLVVFGSLVLLVRRLRLRD
jgi:hypothetical protein